MEITSSAVRCGKNAIPQRFAAVATAWFVLGSSGGNVCAQDDFNKNRLIIRAFESGFVPLVSGFETSLAPTNPPAIFKEQFIGKIDWGEGSSVSRIIQEPAMAQIDPDLIHSVRTASFMAQDEGALEKVTVTDGWTPVLPHTPTSVTLWDEIAPPVPARVPVDATLHATPNDVADTEAPTPQ
ncbi:hypothetical protein [Burkholderia sp. PAMC 26561]|jgi:hypothetical protein|nr:hypothetical protein [Burkholderia sp. PAMC 26561]MDP9156206.1 hypothetical protein [Pseudomonadota bacterium]